MDWSILVATTDSRLSKFFAPLVSEINRQIKMAGLEDKIEVLGFYDAGMMSIGEKRNVLLSAARGSYISFVDDDDYVSPNYIKTIYNIVASGEWDAILFNIQREGIGTESMLCRHSVQIEGDGHMDHQRDAWVSPPNHIMVWRSKIAKSEKFPHKNWMEDHEWSRSILNKVQKSYSIEIVLYWYRMNIELAEEKGIEWNYHGRHIDK